MWIGVLGPLEVHLDGSDVPLEAAKERELLSALAVRCPEVVSRAWLIEVLWGSDPPATAERTLASHVSRLRHAVGATAVLTEPGGYRLDTDLTRTDAGDLAVLTRSAEDELRAGRVTTARCHAAEALRLWRGDPLADLTNEEIRTSETVRLDELRRRATRAFVDAELALGNHEAVIADLEAAVAREPLHEPWWGQLMIALYRSGRQADALRAYERLRVHLCDELGIEPAPDIAALQVRILRQDPALDPVPPPIPTNLPAPIGSFIGRTTERRRLAKALDQDRVVSLVGTGGVGKTRLALETAADVMDRYGDGVWWVDLAPIHHGTEITPAIRRAIGLRDGVAVSEHLRQHPDTLVVLDNAEHLTDAVAPIVRSLAESTAVHVLVTSRERLSVAGEVRITLEPLPTPSDDAPDDGLGSSEAVRLFLDRAASMTEDASDVDLTAVASICRLLDGVPLAIEVAAARTVAFRPRQIADELAKRCAAISDQPAITDPRYSSLGEAIGWSVDLLDPPARQLYPQLSVFVGGFEADDVEQVCTIEHATTSDALWQLVDASLVRVDTDLNAAIDRHRFDLLAAIRDDALRRLDDADADALEARHSSHFRRLLVDSSSGRSASPSAPPRIRAQHGNLHRAWETTLRSGGTEQLARFTVALAPA